MRNRVTPEIERNATQRRMLDVIWRHQPIARVDIGPIVGLSTMSVTRIARDLIEQGLIEEDVLRNGARGQPSRPLTIKPDAAYAAGVYFSQHVVQIGLINLAGQVVAQTDLNTDARTPGALAEAARNAIDAIVGQSGIARDRLAGIGFALPGDFIFDRKRLNAHALFPGFRGEDLQAELQAHFDDRVYVENDAAAAALGERLLGIGQTIGHFFFAHIGYGIGGGLVINGRLYRGARGNAGLIGVQFPNDGPRPSGQDLLATLSAARIEISDFADLETLRSQTCPPLKAWISRAAGQLRKGLWLTARILDPEAVIIGGWLPHHILQEIVARVDDESFCNEGVMLPRPRVFASSLGPAAGVIGAAAIPLYQRYLAADD